ncbi:alpha/beta hydrolase [bacterium]|nr:MAG: alpha/beta hydrolase [bacterium]
MEFSMQINLSVTVGREIIRGFIHLPAKMDTKTPLIILSHGLTGNKYGSHNAWVSMSRDLEKQDIASIRFDFRGNGDSDGLHEQMTVSREVEDLFAIYEYARQYTQNIILGGYSLGAIVTSIVAGRTDAKKILLIAPVAPELFVSLAANMIPLTKDFPGETFEFRDGYLLGRDFMKEMEELPFGGTLSTLKDKGGAIQIIRGDEDPFANDTIASKYKDTFGAKLDIIPGIGHDINTQKASKQLYGLVENFIRNE